MKTSSIVSCAAALAALAFFSPLATAGQISGAGTGLIAPTVQISFDEHVFAANTVITNQYADLGVTFEADGGTSDVYYDPTDNEGPYTGVAGNYLGNFASGGAAEVQTLMIAFATPQTRAAFGLASNGTDFLFEIYLGTTLVDSFVASVDAGYFGFTDAQPFDRLFITSPAPGAGAATDFYLLDNIQFDGLPVTPNAIPEPEVAASLGLGLLALAALRRRRRAAA